MNVDSLLDDLETKVISKAYSSADKVFLAQEIREVRYDFQKKNIDYNGVMSFCKVLLEQYS